MVAEALKNASGCGAAPDYFARITRLREVHTAMYVAVLKPYGWVDIKPEHGFYELDFLPENDRVRNTKAPEAERVMPERLLELNFRRKAEEGSVEFGGKCCYNKGKNSNPCCREN
jgi:hypothetical protein